MNSVMLTTICSCVVSLFHTSSSAGISNYVNVCDAQDPNLDECVRARAQDLWPQLMKGIKDLGILPLEPLRMPLVRIQEGQAGSGISINITDSLHYGWKEGSIKSASIDLKNNHFEFVLNFPRYMVVGNYQIRGRILVIPIIGTGHTNITIADTDTTIKFDGTPEMRSGKKYFALTNVRCEFKIRGKSHIEMSNLFGNKELSDSMNTFLNENADQVFKDFQPAFEEVSSKFYWAILENFFRKVPYSKLFVGV